ncbi:FadR/GntR family transcriptional regulator [Mycolicibacterium confluentis]|uniref:Transcriptional regulator n=1 Tax=Mycolicibacterium confluentis TaxID=28047 RepID=A0A7I7Y232_9MYCO|nr:FCD domain-containing protein [Mycolicibacterium confluentis]MCV7320615.1 FadR family transcriptional regulator [Mycolicibacterium confluentis]ORV30265.1 hypothetical protein AWB99_14285 [Mycolicibacterium confluentis]BBZ35657.1 transcriptional regulator [Mycolicibacterium confluentis]
MSDDVRDLIVEARASVVQDIVYAPIRGGALSQQVVRRIAEAISVGILRPGDRLPPESQFASWLGVSVAVVREALAILRETGYVETERGHGGGTVVRRGPEPPTLAEARQAMAKFTPEYVSDLMDLRVAISGEAAALAAQRAPDSALSRISELAAQMCTAESYDDYRQIDPRFHIAISGASGSTRLAAAEVRLQVEIGEMAAAILRLAPDIETSTIFHTSDDGHRDIVQALTRRDAEGSRAAMTEHVLGMRDLFVVTAARIS